MRRKIRSKVIYKYQEKRRKRNAKRVNISNFIKIIIIFAVGGALGVFLYGFLDSSSLQQSFAVNAVSDKLLNLVTPTPNPDSLPLNTRLLFVSPNPTFSLSPTPTNKPLDYTPVANAQTEGASDYCVNVPILLYHHVQPYDIATKLGHEQLTVDSGYFDEQMAYLVSAGYHSISAEELADALIYHHEVLPKSIMITIDDGYDDNYTYAYQILKKYQIQGNFMIPAGLIGKNGYMSWDQVREIANDPRQEITNHTWSHAYLGTAGRETIEQEVTSANDVLERQTGKKIRVFTYPYGSFSPLVIDVLKEHGFIEALSTEGGNIQCQSYIMTLHRIHIGNAPLSNYGF